MSKILKINKTLGVPTGTPDDNTLYLSKMDSTPYISKAHKAWRIKILTDQGNPAFGVMSFSWQKAQGTSVGTGTNFASAGTADNAFDGSTSTSWLNTGGSLPAILGTIFSTPVAPVQYRVTMNGSIPARLGELVVQYSDDTTNGVDGTWVDISLAPAMTSNVEVYAFSKSRQVISVSSDTGGVLYSGLSTAQASDALERVDSDIERLKYVDDITQRDALELSAATLVFVRDASDDPTIDSGNAIYQYSPSTGNYLDFFKGLDTNEILNSEW